MAKKPENEFKTLLEKYASGRVPPLVDEENPDLGLVRPEFLEIYWTGFMQAYSMPTALLLASMDGVSTERKWERGSYSLPKWAAGWWTDFCKTLRGKKVGDKRCEECDRRRAAQAEEKKRAIAYLCHGGLIDFAVPIFAGQQVIAVLLCGQLWPQEGQTWNPEFIQHDGIFESPLSSEKGESAQKESFVRARQTEMECEFSSEKLTSLLSSVKRATPQDVATMLEKLTSLGNELSRLVTASLESERSRVCSWIQNGVSHSLAQLMAETSGGRGSDFKGVVNISVRNVWEEMARYLEYTCHYFGFAHLVVLSCDYQDGNGTIALLSHYGRSSKDFPFPRRYNGSSWHASLQALSSEMLDWRFATPVDLERYASLPVIHPLYSELRRRQSVNAYAISGQFIKGISPVLILGGVDYRKRIAQLSQRELAEFTTIGESVGLVANICSLVDEQDKAAERQGRFIEDVAHDIRNPIQNLIAMTDFVQVENIPVEAKRKTLRNIVAEVKRIHDLGQRVWVLEDLRRGLLEPRERQQVSAFDVIMRCRKSLLNRAEQSKVTVKVDYDLQKWPKINANPELLYHTILNLMDNAVKYSTPNTEVRIGGELKAREYVLTFGNIGIGIPEDQKERIFERYYRTNNARLKAREGSGIGLAIVKAFADAYGSVEVESTQPEGSSQYLTIFRLRIRRE